LVVAEFIIENLLKVGTAEVVYMTPAPPPPGRAFDRGNIQGRGSIPKGLGVFSCLCGILPVAVRYNNSLSSYSCQAKTVKGFGAGGSKNWKFAVTL
jgi:hypothetical protein